MNISTAQARQLGLQPKQSKYRNRKAEYNGISFDSCKEATKYAELLLLQKAGEIIAIELQPVFVLQEGFLRDGKFIRPITYRADFRVTYKDGTIVIMDVKPSATYQTVEYRLKKKLLLKRFPEIQFKEIY
jgi:hypothetical protein